MTLYKALDGKLVRMWTGKDSEGVGKQAGATVDDVLISDTFDQVLSTCRFFCPQARLLHYEPAGLLTPYDLVAPDLMLI